jgi:hypothetical protein
MDVFTPMDDPMDWPSIVLAKMGVGAIVETVRVALGEAATCRKPSARKERTSPLSVVRSRRFEPGT